MSTALQAVRQVQAAFARGDIPAIVELPDGDVQCEAWAFHPAQAAGVHRLRAGTGKHIAAAR